MIITQKYFEESFLAFLELNYRFNSYSTTIDSTFKNYSLSHVDGNWLLDFVFDGLNGDIPISVHLHEKDKNTKIRGGMLVTSSVTVEHVITLLRHNVGKITAEKLFEDYYDSIN